MASITDLHCITSPTKLYTVLDICSASIMSLFLLLCSSIPHLKLSKICCIVLLLGYSCLVISAENRMTNLNITSITAINTQSASVLDAGTWALGIRNDLYQYQQFADPQLAVYATQSGRVIESDRYFNILNCNIAYGILKTFTIGLIAPYSRLDNIRTADAYAIPSLSQPVNSQGFGDTAFYGQWLIIDRNISKISSMLTFGASAPFGKTMILDKSGMPLSPLDQPGRGAWAPFIGLALTKTLDQSSLNANLQYTKGLEGSQQAQIGDLYNYNIGFVHTLYRSSANSLLDGILELNGEYNLPTVIANIQDPDSGSHLIYISPGLRATTSTGFSPYIGLSIPAFQAINGIQSPIKYWLTFGIDITK